jgi:hypothetical protein
MVIIWRKLQKILSAESFLLGGCRDANGSVNNADRLNRQHHIGTLRRPHIPLESSTLNIPSARNKTSYIPYISMNWTLPLTIEPALTENHAEFKSECARYSFFTATQSR